MDVIYTLIPAMILLGVVMLLVLIWAVRRGQYEDFEGDGQRILLDDDEQPVSKDAAKKKSNPAWPDADPD